jgi:leucine dehydrogenase
MKTREIIVPGYERVVIGQDDEAGYHGIISIHSTALGPAVGGTRLWNYRSEDEAITDALRLSRGMTYKNALAGLPCGGGKSIIIRPPGIADRAKLFRAHGRLIETFGGTYITAEDVGTSPADMDFILEETLHVAGLQGRSGDPSPNTARGVFRAIQAAARFRWDSDALSGRTVAIQGCGHVGYYLGRELAQAGARLIVADVDQSKMQRMVQEYGAAAVPAERIMALKADIFAPCALGGVLNDRSIPELQSEIVAGGANNQLLEPRHGDLIEQRGILYAPDYAANAGGVINGCCRELMGWDEARARARVDAIYDTLLNIFRVASREQIPTYQAADRLAEQRLTRAVAR